MPVVNVLQAKSSLSRLVEAVETGAEPEIIITRNGRPAARLAPIRQSAAGKRIGIAKGKCRVPATIDQDETAILRLFSGKPD